MSSLLNNTDPTDGQIRKAIKRHGNYRVMKKHGRWYVADDTNHLVSNRNWMTNDEILSWFEQYLNERIGSPSRNPQPW